MPTVPLDGLMVSMVSGSESIVVHGCNLQNRWKLFRDILKQNHTFHFLGDPGLSVWIHYVHINLKRLVKFYHFLCRCLSFPSIFKKKKSHFDISLLTAVNTSAVSEKPVSAGGWMETSASTSHIHNGCTARPCSHRDVCVPTSSVSTSPASASYVCLPLPSQCGDPEAVSHGDVIVSGSSQDDVAHVTCGEGYVASPRSVSVEIKCLVSLSAYLCVCE